MLDFALALRHTSRHVPVPFQSVRKGRPSSHLPRPNLIFLSLNFLLPKLLPTACHESLSADGGLTSSELFAQISAIPHFDKTRPTSVFQPWSAKNFHGQDDSLCPARTGLSQVLLCPHLVRQFEWPLHPTRSRMEFFVAVLISYLLSSHCKQVGIGKERRKGLVCTAIQLPAAHDSARFHLLESMTHQRWLDQFISGCRPWIGTVQSPETLSRKARILPWPQHRRFSKLTFRTPGNQRLNGKWCTDSGGQAQLSSLAHVTWDLFLLVSRESSPVLPSRTEPATTRNSTKLSRKRMSSAFGRPTKWPGQ